MYYDMQSDRLYDNESAMEGIFSKLKDKFQNRKENQKHVNEKTNKAIEELSKAVKILEQCIGTAIREPVWKELPFEIDRSEYQYAKWGVFISYDIFTRDYYQKGSDASGEECLNFIIKNLKRELSSNKITVEVYDNTIVLNYRY